MQLRRRHAADLEQLEILARRVHTVDGYPIYLPDGDFRRFLMQPQSLNGWVATHDDKIIGHVALNATTSKPVMDAVADLNDDRPAVYVARLLVDPSSRRSGAGRTLLKLALDEAVSNERLPVLDVVDTPTAAPAIALYRAEGWAETARVRFDLGDLHLEEIVFVGPTA
ncbi:MAG: GNAT family N-acetyltransferase [Actinomycetota bacterium]